MTPDELYEQYEHLANETMYRMFKNNIRSVCKRHSIDKEDLFQYAKTGLWKGCLSFDTSRKVKFTTHAINNIKWHVLERLGRETSLIKLEHNKKYTSKDLYKIVSLDFPLEYDIETFHSIVASDYNINEHTEGNLYIDNVLNRLEGFEKEVLKCKLRGKTFEQIGNMNNMTGENVRRYMRRIRMKFKYFREVGLV